MEEQRSLLTDADVARLANAFFNEGFITRLARMVYAELRRDKAAYWIEPETHAEQHAFLRELITEWKQRREKEKRRADFWRDIKKTVFGWIIISVIGAAVVGVGKLGWLLWELFKAAHKGGFQ